MLSNDDLKDKISNIPELRAKFLDVAKNGGYKWADVRWFQTVIYPEHFKNVNELYDCIRSFGMPCSLSPLHDSDLKDIETGELKKAHYHFIAYYKGKTSLYRFYSMMCASFGEDSFSTFDNVVNANMMVRYFAHLDDKDKFQYNVDDIKDFNGFCSSKYLVPASGDIMSDFRAIKKIIKEHNFIFYNELDDYLDEYEQDLYSAMLHNPTLIRQCKEYMKSREHQMKYDGEIEVSRIRKVLPDGEIQYLSANRFVG